MTEERPAAELDGVSGRPADLAALALTGYGHFTTMRVTAGRVRGLDLHLQRLVRDCRTVFDADLDPARVRELARRVAGPAEEAATLRITVFDPSLDIGRPVAGGRPRILVTRRPAGAGSPPPPLRLRTVTYRRDLPAVKHTGLFGALHQRRSVQRAGFDDALFVDPAGLVGEGPTWNIAVVEDGRVLWPAAECLPGVTMRLLAGTLHRLGIDTRTVPVPRGALTAGRAAFVTNAAFGLRPVASIDGVALADASALLDALRTAYDAIPGQPL